MEVIQPKRSGKKATAILHIEVLVEIEESDSFYDMEEQANAKLRKHVVEGKGFYPMRASCETIHEGVTVQEMIQKTTINPKRGW